MNPRRIADMWSSLRVPKVKARAGKGWLEHPEDTGILIKPSKLYEVI